MSTIIFLDRRIASEFEYLIVKHLNGKTEHVPGPCSMFENPTLHAKITVVPALK